MNNEQMKGNQNPDNMAEIAAYLADDPTIADDFRKHEAATRIVSDLILERMRQGMTQRDMARRMGVAPSTVSRFEDKPDEQLELGFLSRYANALGCRMAVVFDDMAQTDASRIKASVFAIQRQLGNLTRIARKYPDDEALCEGIAKFQAEVLLNFLVKYEESADIPRVFDFISRTGAEVRRDSGAESVAETAHQEVCAVS